MGLRHVLNPLVCYEIRAETLEWDILNPDRLITRGEQALFNLEIKKKRRSRIDLDIHLSSVQFLKWHVRRRINNGTLKSLFE